ncbi:MAG: 23S rRNA (adenine(2503)-C(2))-methyltransferase RlmN [Dehalococcoidales bacterium]|nr:23S rRNA (adenine(2503)-C(2))-methyltransferase RlmN [Dehalococcoidales bacterium]
MSKAITDLTVKEVNEMVASLGVPSYRVKQLLVWVYQKLAVSYDEMTDLPVSFRRELEKQVKLHALSPVRDVRAKDGTIKVLFELVDGKTVESALMSAPAANRRHRYTVCVSTQVGCPIGCPFCATGQQGFERNLTPGEIIDQVLYFARKLKDMSDGREGERVDNIVFMGMGEPLANYDALRQAIEMLNSPDAFGLSARSMTISSTGLLPQIEKLGKEKLQVGLAISLHAPDNALRDKLVPINKKYPLEKLVPACRNYFARTGRRVSFEYVLLEDVNDSLLQAQALAGLLRGMNCHVNLIPANITTDETFRPSPRSKILAFQQELKNRNINCTLRQSRGQDIDAGCGQLRSRFTADKNRQSKR